MGESERLVECYQENERLVQTQRGLLEMLARERERAARMEAENRRLRDNWNTIRGRLKRHRVVFDEIKNIQGALSDIDRYRETDPIRGSEGE